MKTLIITESYLANFISNIFWFESNLRLTPKAASRVKIHIICDILLKHTKQILSVSFCDVSAEIGVSLWAHRV